MYSTFIVQYQNYNGENFFEQQPDFINDLGTLLTGANSDIKALSMGAIALLGGESNIQEIHSLLVKSGANDLHSFTSTHIRDPLKSLPEGLIVIENDNVSLSPLGNVSAHLGIHLLSQSDSSNPSVSLNRLVGGNKRTSGQVLLPAPVVRLGIYKILTGTPGGITIRDIGSRFNNFRVTPKTIRMQVLKLESNGFVENNHDRKGLRRLTPAGKKTVKKYISSVDDFISQPYNPDYTQAMILNILTDRVRVATMVKRSILQSGKAEGHIINDLNARLGVVFSELPYGTSLTTTQLAELLGITHTQATTYLPRIVSNLNGNSTIRLLKKRASGQERLWVMAPRPRDEIR